MEAISFVAWRVLKKARQAAIKRRRENYAATLELSRRSSANASAYVGKPETNLEPEQTCQVPS